MTEQEQQLISGLAERIKNAPAPQIDRDAYDLILHTIGARPDALYILTQTVLIQEMALNQAKAQIEELKRRSGSSAGAAAGRMVCPGRETSHRVIRASGYSYPTPPPHPPPSGGGFSGFLHNAATTAAGVIAGEIAFDSISSIFGHRGGFFGGGGGGFFGGDSGISPGSETIVNNYYGDDRNQGAAATIPALPMPPIRTRTSVRISTTKETTPVTISRVGRFLSTMVAATTSGSSDV